MARALVIGLLTVVGTCASGLVGLIHGDLIPTMLGLAAVASGAGACLAALQQKILQNPRPY
jgi:uncharacterized membrane protein YuzA (DUF378 family)